MWWIPVAIVGAWVVKKCLEDDETYSPTPSLTTLEKNFLRLKEELENHTFKSIAIIGQPGAGKSSLLDTMTDGRCIPRPQLGQATDTTDWSNSSDTNLVNKYYGFKFIDTPGYDTLKHPTRSYIEYFPFNCVSQVILLIRGKVHQADEEIYNKLIRTFGDESFRKVLLVRGFSDDLTEKERREILEDFDAKLRYRKRNIKVVFLSNRYKHGIMEVQRFIGI